MHFMKQPINLGGHDIIYIHPAGLCRVQPQEKKPTEGGTCTIY